MGIVAGTCFVICSLIDPPYDLSRTEDFNAKLAWHVAEVMTIKRHDSRRATVDHGPKNHFVRGVPHKH